MKTILLILLMFPVICFAQNEHRQTPVPNKPSTTDCPTWNKKGKKSKADYFQYLRSTKPKSNPNATSNDYSKIQPNQVTKKTEDLPPTVNEQPTEKKSSTEEVVLSKPKKIKKSHSFFSEHTTTANSSTEQKTIVPKSEDKTKLVEVSQSPKTTEVITTEKKQNEESVQDSAKAGDKKVEAKENGTTEKTKLKRKMSFLFRKRTKVHKHSNSKCPSF
jgi:hypothetical protein